MEHIDRFLELRYIEDSIGPALIPNPEFLDARSDRRHRLPIIRIFALLNFEELKSGCFLHRLRKLAKILPSRANKMNRFHRTPWLGHLMVCQMWHVCKSPVLIM